MGRYEGYEVWERPSQVGKTVLLIGTYIVPPLAKGIKLHTSRAAINRRRLVHDLDQVFQSII